MGPTRHWLASVLKSQGSDVPKQASVSLSKPPFVPLGPRGLLRPSKEDGGPACPGLKPGSPPCLAALGRAFLSFSGSQCWKLSSWGSRDGIAAHWASRLPLSADSPAGRRGLWEHLQLHPHRVPEGECKCAPGRHGRHAHGPPRNGAKSSRPGTAPHQPLGWEDCLFLPIHLAQFPRSCHTAPQIVCSLNPTLPPSVMMLEKKTGFV